MASLPPKVIEHPSTHWSDRQGESIRAIVGHGTAGTDSLAYLTKNPRKVSIPYLIARDGTIYHMVPDSRAANHAGAATSTLLVGNKAYKGGEVNRVTTGFELESLQEGKPTDYTMAQLLSMGWLINDMRRKHGAIPVVRHATLDPTRRSDPVGLTVAMMESWADRAAHPGVPDTPTIPDPPKQAQLPGVNGLVFSCSAVVAGFYMSRGGPGLFGLLTANEAHKTDARGQLCTITPTERVIIKNAPDTVPHLALRDEITKQRWP